MKTSNELVTIIKPSKGWQLIDLKEILRYRDLFTFLIYRDIKVLYKQTILGFSWAIINPVLNMLIFSFIFGKMGKMASDGLPWPIFSYTALIPWTYFSNALNASTTSLITANSIITKVYFPRIVIPLTATFSKLVDFAISFLVLIVLMISYRDKIHIDIDILMLPLLTLIMMMFASGIGMWLSALALQYRDVKFAMPFFIQILMFLSPVVWAISALDKYGSTVRFFYGLYPMAGVISGFRSALLGNTPMPYDLILLGSVSSIIIFIGGAFYFTKTEKIFADVA